jgi:predicted alpha/beta-hydrolase family hydrolase
MKDLTYSYNSVTNSEDLNVIVHGGGEGINSVFIQKIKNVYDDESTLLIQMPFMDRGEEGTTTPTFDEEIKTVEDVMKQVDLSKIKNINFVGKSIGAHILIAYIYKNYSELDNYNLRITFLGMLVDLFKYEETKPIRISILQGTKDKYGSIDDIISMIKQSNSPLISLVRFENADHSFKDENKNPIYQNDVIDQLALHKKLAIKEHRK